MKSKISLFILLFSCIQGHSQTSGDFKIITDFKDTLVTGYQNVIFIETDFDMSRVLITGEKMSISSGSKVGEYKVIVSAGTKTAELIINYTSKDGTTDAYIYTYRIVPLTENMIKRIQKK